MKDTDKILEFKVAHGSALIPVSQDAIDNVQQSKHDTIKVYKDVTPRDLRFHKGFFAMMNYIYQWLPSSFKNAVPQDKFYIAVKELRGDYTIINIGSKQVKEYTSISFAMMNNSTFEDYVRELLPFIYDDIIRPLMPDTVDMVIDNIEHEFRKLLSKL